MKLNPLERLNPAQRKIATWSLIGLAILLFLVVPVALQGVLFARRSEVAELKAAVDAVQAARIQVRERQSKKDFVQARYSRPAPQLAGFLDQLAHQNKVEISDTSDRPEVPVGNSKRYKERSTNVKLKKSGLRPISTFFAAIEQSGHPVAISKLNMRRRLAENDSYDVDVVVSAFDRTEEKKAPVIP